MTSPCPVDEWKQIIIHVDASRRRRVNWVERHSSRQQRAIIPPGPGSAGRRWNLLGLCNTNIQSTHRHYNTSSLTLILYFFGPSLPEWRHSQWRQSGRREKKKEIAIEKKQESYTSFDSSEILFNQRRGISLQLNRITSLVGGWIINQQFQYGWNDGSFLKIWSMFSFHGGVNWIKRPR